MKHLLTVLLAITVLLISFSGCSTSRETNAPFTEKATADCFECRPDFKVDSKSWQVMYNETDSTIQAQVCVSNDKGEYTNKVQIGWALSAKSDYNGSYYEKFTNFDSEPNSQKNEKCFYQNFKNVSKSKYYYVYFSINDNREVLEQSLDNNFGLKFIDASKISENKIEFVSTKISTQTQNPQEPTSEQNTKSIEQNNNYNVNSKSIMTTTQQLYNYSGNCFETDNRLDLYVAGTVMINNNGYVDSFSDYCFDATQIYEFYCANQDSTNVSTFFTTCDSSCINNACVYIAPNITIQPITPITIETYGKLYNLSVGEFMLNYTTFDNVGVWFNGTIIDRNQFLAAYTTNNKANFAIVRVAEYFTQNDTNMIYNAWLLSKDAVSGINTYVSGYLIRTYSEMYSANLTATNYLWKSANYVVNIQGVNTTSLELAQKYLEMYPAS